MVIKKKWGLAFSKRAQKDAKLLKNSNLKSKAEILLNILEKNPFISPPYFKKLVGDLDGYYSRRINIQHRIVYYVDESSYIIKILSMWCHYND